ncbi:MRC1-like domain-containing protein [Suillus paluster]|uniref:MRC1-like domain-containing protein n=1 Tax=Suillus paluster TaxID=48578 RepID=UPI001B884F7B|nr:MRC1-like domain-containing protein [Suillus paluster]KAG1753709.1 MRC1-like domain-containing protein [Suillus paluster]
MSAMDVDQPSPKSSPVKPIKRAVVTYGRRRDPQPEIRDSSVTLTDRSSPRVESESLGGKESESTHELAPDALQGSQSSSTTYANDDDMDDASPKHQFGWRAQLKALDEAFDNDKEPLARPRVTEPSSSSPPQKPFQSHPFEENQITQIDITPPPAPQNSDGPFDALLPPTNDPPASTVDESLEDSPIISRKVRRPRNCIDSDSEREDSSSASPIRNPINTPLLRSPPTPSTSEFEMPSMKHKANKGKGKAIARDVPPLRFESESASIRATSKKGNKARRKDESVRPKTKAPTKKDLRETVLESSRIIASKNVEVARTEQPKHTMTWFFERIKDEDLRTEVKQPEPPSDPISNFSSPPVPPVAGAPDKVEQGTSSFGAPSRLLGSSAIVPPRARTPPRNLPGRSMSQPQSAASDSDGEMPIFSDLLRQDQAKRKEADDKRALAELKQRALQDAARRFMANDSDDDLEIVDNNMHVTAQEEAAKRKADKLQHITPSKGKARQLALGRKSLPGPSGSRAKPFAQANLSECLKESAMSSFDRKVRGKDKAPLTTQQLNRALMQRAEARKLQTIQQREEEWKQRGGRVLEEAVEAGEKTSCKDRLRTYVQKGLDAAERDDSTIGDMEADDTDEDDTDYAPEERGSASPEPTDTDCEGDSDQENQATGLNANDGASQHTDAEDEELQVRRRGIRRPLMVASDEEDDAPRILVPDSSMLDLELASNAIVTRNSESDQTEDENDKENSQTLMYDRSEDKENKAVVRHSHSVARPPLGSRPGSLLDIEDGVHRISSPSPSLCFDGAPGSPEQNLRLPLKEIAREDDSFSSSPSSKSPFTTRLLRSTSKHPTLPPGASNSRMSLDSPPTLQLGLGSSFSDIENDENMVKGFEPRTLLPSFSETLTKRSPAPFVPLDPLANGSGFSQLFSDDKDEGFSCKDPTLIGDCNELSLSLDVGLEPALEVSSTLRRKADGIFEKEQEYVMEIANGHQKQGKSPPKYVGDNGFLTQTWGPNVEQYRPNSFQSPQFLASQVLLGDMTPLSSERAPLRTLSFMATQESSDVRPLRRLRRRSTSPLDGKTLLQDDDSLLPPLTISQLPKRNAFEVLGGHPKSNAPKRKLEKSEFIATEAVESDEDELIGFGPIKKDEEEAEDDDDEKIVEGLVDDAVMDVDTERADLVQEKFREHEEEDDKKLEKLHHDAVEGKLRMKRRDRGIGFDEDSDDEDEDENNRRIRRSMNKKRKVDGDTLEDLGRNEATKAFYDAYQNELMDDDLEFVHLQTDTRMASEDEDEETRKVVLIEDLNAELREAAKKKESFETLDPEDTSWIDRADEENDGNVPVKVMAEHSSKPPAKRPAQSHTDFGLERPNRILENDQEKTKLRSWARGQGGGNQGTGRSAVGAAITGHAKAKVKIGGGSLRTAQAAAGSNSVSSAPVPRKLEKGRSMLSGVSDRSSRFA